MNRLRFIFISVVALLSVGHAAAYDFESGGLFYNILDAEAKTVEVTCRNFTDWDTQSDYTGDIVVPAIVENGGTTYKVIKIGQLSFKRSEITSLTISEGIEIIGQDICEGCGQLKELSLPTSLKSIEYAAFWSCYSLTSVSLPEGLITLGNDVFHYCSGMKDLQLPSTLTEIGERAFGCCGSLTRVKSNILTPFAISNATFSSDESWNNGVNNPIPSSAYLIVPQGTKSAYMSYEGWTTFAGIYEGEPQEITLPDGLKYSYITDERIATVIGWENLDSEELTIRSIVEINGENYNVKSVGPNAFSDCGIIRSITFEDGIETIGNYAFRWCYNLRSISFSSTIKKLNVSAFQSCNQLSSLTIPEGVQVLEDWAFSDCNKLSKVELPSTLTSMGNGVFWRCSSLYAVNSHIQTPFDINQNVFASEEKWNEQKTKNYYVPSSATLYVPTGTKSNYEAFEGWNMFADIVEGELKEVTIDGINYSYTEGKGTATVIGGDYSEYDNVTILGVISVNGMNYTVKEVGKSAFENCYSLKSVVFGEGIEIIADHAFDQCTSLSSIQFPSTLKTIGYEAFQSCNGGPDIILPEGLESIGGSAFHASYSNKIELPSTLKSIGNYAFTYLNSSATVISHIEEPFEIEKNVFSNGWYWDYDKEIVTPSSATLLVPIGTKAKYETYEGWMMFAEVLEGSEVVSGMSGDLNYRFVKGSNVATVIEGDYYPLNEVTIPTTVAFEGTTYRVTGIAADVFNYKQNLKSVKIENGIEIIGDRAFRECYNLNSLTLPESVTKIGEEAFAYCGNIEINIPSKVVSIGSRAFIDCTIKNFVIPKTTTSIGYHAFHNCKNITSIRVEDGNQYYDSRNNCNALIETATNKLMKGSAMSFIPNSVVEIADQAFYHLPNLSDITIPNSVTSIGYSAFADCDRLTSVRIPSSVTYIASEAFAFCDALTSISVDPNNTVFDSRNDCNAIIEKNSLRLILACKNTVIPRGVKIIGDAAFRGVVGLDSLKIPYGVEKIEQWALSYNEIKYIEIPNSVKEMGNEVFQGCDNLISLVSKIKDPSRFWAGNAFWNSNVYNATLYVPKGLKDAYMNADGWNNFSTIEEMDGQQLVAPSLSYDGRYVTATSTDKDVDMYYSIDGGEPSNYYDGPIAVYDLGTVKVMAEKSFSADSEVATQEIEYLYTGDTLKLTRAGLMADAIKWCGSNQVEKMTVVGPISTDEFETVRTLSNLRFLNLAQAEIENLSLPDNAFANSNIVSFVAPAKLSSVGSGIFSGCQQLAAVNWDTDKALPSDALSNVNNPNLLLYLKADATAPAGINNVIKGGTAEKITLVDASGNNNFYCPVAFKTDSIIYTRNFQQKTEVGVSRGWETIVLPFNVQNIRNENLGDDYQLTPFASYNGWDNQRPFWLYTLEQNDIRPAYNIEANVPYLICMPNADEYGDQYNLAGNVIFKAGDKTNKITIEVSKPIEMTQSETSFVPTYQSVPASADVFALNVNQEYKGYPAGSLFVNNFREVRPFEAYSVHPSAAAKVSASRMFTVGSLIGGGEDTTGIIDVMLKKKNDGTNSDAVVRVYSLSGALVKQGKAEDVTNGLPKGIYIANGKKFVVK